MNILITGDIELPPPHGGQVKRLLNNVSEWKKDNNISVLSYHKKDNFCDFNSYYIFDIAYNKIFTNSIIFFIKYPTLSMKILSKASMIALKGSFSLTKLFASLHYSKLIYDIIRNDSINVIEAHYAFETSYITELIAEDLKVPIVIMSYAEAIEWSGKKEGKHIDNISEKFSPLFKEVYSKAKKIIVPSRHCAKGPLKYVPEDKIEIIYSGIVPIETATVTKNDKKIILYVGQLDPRKGAIYLAKIAKEIIKSFPNTYILFVGADTGNCTIELKEISGDKNIIFTGTLSDKTISELYNCADVLVFPSISEQECMGMSMKEALSCGTPVVAFNVGGVSEAIEDGVTGYLVESKNSQQLAEKIIKILKEDGKTKMREACMEKARELFDIKNLAKKELEVLRRYANE